MKTTATVLAVLILAMVVPGQQNETPADHHATLNQRGDQVMGFSHEKTTHHFLLYNDGGAIEVLADDPKDTDSRDMIRMHLSHIAKMFAAGDFKAPMLIHDTNPPGVPTMIALRDQIHYQFQAKDAGGKVTIQTANAEALTAIHQFLRFQIAEHQTGDPAAISGSASNR